MSLSARYHASLGVQALVNAYEDDPTRGELTPEEWMKRREDEILCGQTPMKPIALAVLRAYG